MRALFEKDLRLVLIRKSSLFIFLGVGCIFTWTFSDGISGAYLTMLGSLLALSTISYDEADNCMSFLLTLPCDRKHYVIEKYMFVYGFSFAAGIVGLVMILIANVISKNPVSGTIIAETIVTEIPILVVTGGIMIPLQIKFGAEKSRIVLLVIIGAVFAVGYMVERLIALGNDYMAEGTIDDYMTKVGSMLRDLNSAFAITGMLIVLVVLSVISAFITIKIIEKKEY